MKGDLNKDGKMSSYETRRSNAIQKAMGKRKTMGVSKIECGPGKRYNPTLKKCVPKYKSKGMSSMKRKAMESKSKNSSRLRNIRSGKIKQRGM
jgi:hypothetical protein